MRSQIGKSRAVRQGDLVEISMRLSRSASYARLSIWSASPGYPMSPHIQTASIGMLDQGKPMMVVPMNVRLVEQKRKATIRFIAEEDLTFCVIQEMDTIHTPPAKARIRAHGQNYQAIRRYCQNAIRRLRRGAAQAFGRA